MKSLWSGFGGVSWGGLGGRLHGPGPLLADGEAEDVEEGHGAVHGPDVEVTPLRPEHGEGAQDREGLPKLLCLGKCAILVIWGGRRGKVEGQVEGFHALGAGEGAPFVHPDGGDFGEEGGLAS